VKTAAPRTYIVAVGGLDPGAGAGLGRDLLTADALGARALLVGTAWTVQSAAGVRGFEPRSVAGVREALSAALAETAGARVAIKIGMVAEARLAGTIAAALEGFAGPVVYDPVLAASSGGALYRGELADLHAIIGRATLVTPNLGEAGLLTGRTVHSLDDARAAANALRARGARGVLVKGGHLPGAAEDLLVHGAGERIYTAARVPGPSPRGTGCALATAIAVALAAGEPLEGAVATAKAWLLERIRTARDEDGERRL
jgi:hydroxymethylpyrimidine/phosphomethylpyrimidine kinase